MNELMDVVDKNDRAVGRATYRKCHEKGLLHRTSTVFIFKDSSLKEVLLMKRDSKISEPNKMCTAGGHVKSGENYLKTAMEEVEEEIFWRHRMPKGLKFRKVGKVFYNDMPNNYEFDTIYYIVYPGPFFPNPEEAKGSIGFHRLDGVAAEVKKNPQKFSAAFLHHFNKLNEYLGR